MSVYVSGVWLLVAAPIAGVFLARVTGALTWQRAALLAAGCQVALVAAYLVTQGIPVRSYGRAPTPTEVRLLKLGPGCRARGDRGGHCCCVGCGMASHRWFLSPASTRRRPNVRCICQSDRHQVVSPSAGYQIQANAARSRGALQLNFMR